jgi:DNA repair exonuclease SbcCD nuclease subunit
MEEHRDHIRILFFADSHLGYDHPLKARSKRKRRGEDFFANFRFILQEAERTKPDLLIHGGDVFDSPYVNESIVNMAYDRLFETAECGIPIFIVPGNHERAKLLPSVFMQHPLIHIFNEAKSFQLHTKGHSIRISGFPYYYDGIRRDFPEILKQLSKGSSPEELKILCMHQVLEGAKVGRHNYTFRANPDVIKVSDLSRAYNCYLSGHIHRYQLLHNPENGIPFLYPGSIERTSWQEELETKGYCILSFQKTDAGYAFSHQFRSLKTRPLETLVFEDRIYTDKELRDLIRQKIKKISKNAVLRYQSEFPENIYKISSKLEQELIPLSISIQKGFWSAGTGYKKKRT